MKEPELGRLFPASYFFFSVGEETDVCTGTIFSIFLLKFRSYKDNIENQSRERAGMTHISRGLR